MSGSLSYSAFPAKHGWEVTISQFSVLRFAITAPLAALFVGLAVLVVLRDMSSAAVAIACICLLLAGVALAFGYTSLRRTKFRCSSSDLWIRGYFFGIPLAARRIRREHVRNFGFGLFGTNLAPVIRFEIEEPPKVPRWIVVAVDVEEYVANKMLDDLLSVGVELPPRP